MIKKLAKFCLHLLEPFWTGYSMPSSSSHQDYLYHLPDMHVPKIPKQGQQQAFNQEFSQHLNSANTTHKKPRS
eukprot:COSAG01_NODE_2312_length_7938_cov_4.108687_5_plen_73_part_00